MKEAIGQSVAYLALGITIELVALALLRARLSGRRERRLSKYFRFAN